MLPTRRATRTTPATETTPTTTVTNAQLQALIDHGVAAALAKRDASRSRDGDNSHGLGTGRRRQVPTQRECTYTDFLKCQPINFKGTVSYHKLYDILKPQQAATRNRGKAIVNSPPPTYDQEHEMVAEDDALPKEKDIDKLMALISLLFKKIYKPTNKNLRTSSNTSAHVVQVSGIQCYNCKEYEHVAEESGFQLNAEQADWRDDTDDEQRSGIGSTLYTEPLQKVQNDDDNYNVFSNDREHPEQPKSVNDTYLEEQGDTNITIALLDMSTNREMVDQDDDDDLARERDLLASLIEKVSVKFVDIQNRNKFNGIIKQGFK
ncbi:hypothetical protein Tco_0164206 [Tanacetum coccineum]